ncbi:HD-GYP domain-containing protein [Erythrobacter sp. NE805]|uniref:HD-GYP domain-containing protein n=1 Tax=Erythrobacter sp. NE805 TaxID=3389875 RepID=UPI00396AFABC
MLKQIPVSQLEIGMFVHKFEGGWFDHPFWKAKFVVDDDEKLAAIRESRLRGVVIDTAKGRDLTPPAVAAAAEPGEAAEAAERAPSPAARRIRSIKRRTDAQLVAAQPVSLAQEVETAAQIAEQARERLGKVFIDARLGKALDVRKVEPVVSDILASVRRNPQAFSGLMRCKLKNEAIFRHALSVSALMVALADRMKLSGPEIYGSGLAGLLLDIGVNYLPQTEGLAGGDYRARDERLWQSHVLLGYRALQNDDNLPPAVLDACLLHHERIDGRGYPQGRAGEDIPLIARMAAVCDSFEFLLAGSLGQPPMDPAAAVDALRAQTGAFDEEILRLFVETVGLYPVGAFVELASRKIAMVIDEDRKDPLRPVVQAFYSLETRERILPHRVALAEPSEKERIVGIADLAGHDLPADDQLRELVFLSACRNIVHA